MSQILSFLGSTVISPLFNFVLPWGVTFGAIVIAIFGLPLLVKAVRKFF